MMSTSKSVVKAPIYFFIFILVKELLAIPQHSRYDFKLVYEWKQIEYKFQSEQERWESIANGTFDVGKLQPIDGQYTFDAQSGREKIFITTPRFAATGYPATVGIVTNDTRDGNPIIDPYPSWSWQINPEECRYHRIVSVFRTWLDECNRLWVVDTGVVGSKFACPPQILAFDLKTDQLIHKYEVPYTQHQNLSLFIAPTVEVEHKQNNCEDTWLYIADSDTPSLLVFSLKQNNSWRVQDESFLVDPKYRTYTIEGDTFVFDDGIFSVALSPKSDGPKKRKLHYHAMSNIKESWVYLRHLKNSKNFEIPYGSPQLFYTYEYKRNQQSATEASDRKGNIYFSLLKDNKLVKWNSRTPYIPNNFETITDDTEKILFPSGLKVVPHKDGKREVLWVFDVAIERSQVGKLNGNITNFRLFAVNLN